MPSEIELLPVPFRVETQVAFPGGSLEIRRYFWSKAVHQTFQTIEDALVLNMALTSRPPRTKVDRLESVSWPLMEEAGRLLVMMPHSPYYISAPSGAFRSLHCALECSKFEQIGGETIDWSVLRTAGGQIKSATKIEHLLVHMLDELVHARIGRLAAIEADASLLCVELLRRFREGRPRRPDIHAGGLAAWRMRLLVDRIHADQASPKLEELSRLCGLTTRQLTRAFKAETGVTLGRYVDEVTMERAHRLLTSSSVSIAEIARQLGFASADSFAQAYRRMTGRAPSRARKPAS